MKIRMKALGDDPFKGIMDLLKSGTFVTVKVSKEDRDCADSLIEQLSRYATHSLRASYPRRSVTLWKMEHGVTSDDTKWKVAFLF